MVIQKLASTINDANYFSEKADMLKEFADDLRHSARACKLSGDAADWLAAQEKMTAAEIIEAEVAVLRELATEDHEDDEETSVLPLRRRLRVVR